MRRVIVTGVGLRVVSGAPISSEAFRSPSIKPNIGAAIALELARHGHEVVLVARSSERLDFVARGIRAELPHAKISVHAGDLLVESECRALAQAVGAGPVDLVHSVGLSAGSYEVPNDNPYLELSDIPAAQLQAELQVPVLSLLNLVRQLGPALKQGEKGRIVVVTSMSGTRAVPLGFSHAAGKGALHLAVRSLALELGPEGVLVSEVAPGIVDTGLYDPPAVKEAVIRMGLAFGYDYRSTGLPMMPPAAVAEAVRLCLESRGHVLNIAMVAAGQWPHAAS